MPRCEQDARLVEDLLRGGRYQEAVDACSQVIAAAPDDAALYVQRSVAWAGLGRADEALADLGEAVALEPDFGRAYHERGVVLSALGRYGEALRDLDRAVRLAPTAAAYSDRASVLLQLSREHKARRDYAAALELDPDLAPVHVNLGVLEARDGRFREAVPHLRRAAQLGWEDAVPLLERARQEAFVAASEDGSMEFAIEAFLDSRSARDLADALDRFPFMVLPEFIESLEGLPPPVIGEGVRDRIQVLRELAED
jgi:tetratricopeptide (TPR) repeat protein